MIDHVWVRGVIEIPQGPELFHFEARVETNSSFCNFTTYFAVSLPKYYHWLATLSYLMTTKADVFIIVGVC